MLRARSVSVGRSPSADHKHEPNLLRDVIPTRTGWNQGNIHRLELKPWFIRIGREVRLRSLKEILIVTFGEVRLVMRTARLVPECRPLRYHTRKLQHVVELSREHEARVRPH